TQVDDIVIATYGGVSAPFDAREADEPAFLCDPPAQIDNIGPRLVGDLEVVGRVAKDIEPADLTPVGEVGGAVVGADRVVGVDVHVSEVGSRRRKLADDVHPVGCLQDDPAGQLGGHGDLVLACRQGGQLDGSSGPSGVRQLTDSEKRV